MKCRYYDPANGLFTQEDPIGLAGGLNLYGFANGDPVNYSDPFGLNPCFIPVAVVCGEIILGAAITTTAWAASHTDDFSAALQGGWDAGRELVGGVVYAVSAKVHQKHLQGQLNNINTHFGKISGPGGEDPDNRNKWKKDIQEGIREMRKRVDKLKGKDREHWEEVVRDVETRVRQQ